MSSREAREGQIADGLRALIEAPADADRLLRSVERRIVRRRRIGAQLVAVGLTGAAVLVAPTVWQTLHGAASMLTAIGIRPAEIIEPSRWLTSVRELPTYVWALLGGVAMTVGTLAVER